AAVARHANRRGLVTEFAGYSTGDDGRHTTRRVLVVQIERIVFAEQTAGNRVVHNSDRALIASEMHAAVDDTVFERNGRRGRKNPWAGVAYPDSPVDDATRTSNFFGADDEIRGPVRDDPAVDRGGAGKQYPTGVDPHAARDVRSVIRTEKWTAKEARIAGVD